MAIFSLKVTDRVRYFASARIHTTVSRSSKIWALIIIKGIFELWKVSFSIMVIALGNFFCFQQSESIVTAVETPSFYFYFKVNWSSTATSV